MGAFIDLRPVASARSRNAASASRGTEFTFADRTAVGAAVASYERGKADFSDYLIGATAASAGASTTFTFDRGLRKSEDFTLVPSR